VTVFAEVSVQSLPRPSATPTVPANGKDQGDPLDIEPDSELAHKLQPLLEQEALVDSFIEEAKAQRKFEDVKTLKMNQSEIRREIERLLHASDLDLQPRNSNGLKR
jgi:rabenosyn-5